MYFHSILFAPFLFFLFFVYHFVLQKTQKGQNLLLLLGSLAFLGLNDLKSCGIILITGLINFAAVKKMSQLAEGNLKKYVFYLGCAANIGVLGYYKYLGTLLSGIQSIFQGQSTNTLTDIIIPIGLSFYTFQLLAYWIDVYNEEIEPETNPLDFGVFILYFPKILSGPIELYQKFSPQIKLPRQFDTALTTDGLRQFLWGFFKKTVISTHCLSFYAIAFPEGQTHAGLVVLLGGMLNIIYIYTDFSGYSDMACGLSKLFGIRLTNNFASPFFSTNISEFWKRWHVSLSSWIMLYVFTPLSFILRRHNKVGVIVSIVTSFVLVGIWHGATSNYIVFGLLHGLFFIPLVLRGGSINASNSSASAFSSSTKMFGTFMLIALTSLFFRDVPVGQTLQEITSIVTSGQLNVPTALFHGATNMLYWLLIIACFVVEYIQRRHEHALFIAILPTWKRWLIYAIVLCIIFFFSSYPSDHFIYVQF